MSSKTVLCVDDDRATLVILRRVIAEGGYYVITENDPERGLLALLERNPDLLILDVRMPKVDGFGFIEQVRRGPFAERPVILLTGETDPDTMMHGYRVGVDCFLTKPVVAEKLLNLIDYLIGDLPEDDRRRLESLI